ncbi:MAG: AlbA family DNA-binding domain-containing protein [Acidimicrobiales bacterium]
MEQGISTPDDFRTELRKRRGRAWISAVIGQPVDGVAPLLHALIVVGPRPEGWTERTWTYSECSFTSVAESTAKLASVLDPERDAGLKAGSVSVGLELMNGNFNWLRKPSLALYDELTLPWPSVAYPISMANQGSIHPPSGYLVGQDDAPSFPTFGAAYNAFYHHNFAVSGTNNPQLGQVSIRLVDARARIGRVRVRPASLEVWVGGRAVQDTRLELNGAEYRTAVDLTRAGRVTFPLPVGLPSDAWLWLKHGTEWRDFRALSWEGSRIRNVETELPRDPIAELSLLATQGEGPHLEYKEKLPDSRDEKRHVFKTVVAFANGDGGTMLFGIGDGGELRGVGDKLPEGRRRLNDLLRDLVDPSPSVRIEAHRLDGRNVLVLEVLSGGGVLHALTLDRNRPEYYVRRDGTTFFARPNEVAAVVQRASQATAIPWFAQ